MSLTINPPPKNWIHPTAIVHSHDIGTDNFFGPYCYIGPNVKIGNNNRFEGFVSIGTNAEHQQFFDRQGEVEIGHGNTIREFVTINASTHGITRMGNKCIMLRGSHLSHDSCLEDHVTVSCNVMIGGESHIMIGSNLGLSSVIHQRQLIGSYCMIGMGAVVTKGLKVIPGNVYTGNPAKFLKQNDVGLKRMRIEEAQIIEEMKRWEQIAGKKV